MEDVFILSNGGDGFYWWGRGDDDRTTRLAAAPRPFRELQAMPCYHVSAPGLFVFGSASGRACCYVANLYAGRRVSTATVYEGVLVVSASAALTDRMKALATAYLENDLQGLSSGGIEPRQLPNFAILQRSIRIADGVVDVDWPGVDQHPDSLAPPVAPVGPHDAPFFVEDSPANRERLRRCVAATTTVPAGAILVAATPSLRECDPADVRWCLTDSPHRERPVAARGSATARAEVAVAPSRRPGAITTAAFPPSGDVSAGERLLRRLDLAIARVEAVEARLEALAVGAGASRPGMLARWYAILATKFRLFLHFGRRHDDVTRGASIQQ